MVDTQLVVAGVVGGVLPDVLRIITKRKDGLPVYLKSGFYWVCLIGLGVIGGALVYWWPGATDVKSALTLGFTGPEFLRRALGGADTPERRGEVTPSAWELQRRWWAG
jgi:hypothetical protein